MKNIYILWGLKVLINEYIYLLRFLTSNKFYKDFLKFLSDFYLFPRTPMDFDDIKNGIFLSLIISNCFLLVGRNTTEFCRLIVCSDNFGANTDSYRIMYNYLGFSIQIIIFLNNSNLISSFPFLNVFNSFEWEHLAKSGWTK